MSDSILQSIKHNLGIGDDYDVFDQDIIMHINSAFGTLNQLGIGPTEGFVITDASQTWDTYLGENWKFASVKTYIFMKVKVVFDPPTLSFLLQTYADNIRELEWRLNVVRETTDWILPGDLETVEEIAEELVQNLNVDGGGP